MKNLLLKACTIGSLENVEFLVESGEFDIHRNFEEGFRTASERGYLDIVKYLVSKGADIHVLDNFALRKALLWGHNGVVNYLVSKGADIKTGKGSLKYDYVFSVNFSLQSDNSEEKVNESELLNALEKRLNDLKNSDNEIIEACGEPKEIINN